MVEAGGSRRAMKYRKASEWAIQLAPMPMLVAFLSFSVDRCFCFRQIHGHRVAGSNYDSRLEYDFIQGDPKGSVSSMTTLNSLNSP